MLYNRAVYNLKYLKPFYKAGNQGPDETGTKNAQLSCRKLYGKVCNKVAPVRSFSVFFQKCETRAFLC